MFMSNDVTSRSLRVCGSIVVRSPSFAQQNAFASTGGPNAMRTPTSLGPVMRGNFRATDQSSLSIAPGAPATCMHELLRAYWAAERDVCRKGGQRCCSTPDPQRTRGLLQVDLGVRGGGR